MFVCFVMFLDVGKGTSPSSLSLKGLNQHGPSFREVTVGYLLFARHSHLNLSIVFLKALLERKLG